MEKENVRITYWKKDANNTSMTYTFYFGGEGDLELLKNSSNLSTLKTNIVERVENQKMKEKARLEERKKKIEEKLASS